ncbi:MAG: phosphotransferase [Deltaproteobacteria bacterium]|nr:phosphotransferase [Deltaproteobacteria bacterium]
MRAFPGRTWRLLPASERGAHRVARAAVDGNILYAKACLDPQGDVSAELAAIRAAGSTLAPAIVNAARPTPNRRWFVMQAAPGRPSGAWSAAELGAVAKTLARLHRVSVPNATPALAGGGTLASTLRSGHVAIDKLRGTRVLDAKDARVVSAALTRAGRPVRELVDLEPQIALCHGDVRSPNVFFAGPGARPTATLLDFEHAGRGDPAIDLARACAYERLSSHRWFVLCDAYAEAVGDDATVDRAISLAPAMALILALQAARFAVEVLGGRIASAAAAAVARRLPEIGRRVETVVGELDGARVRVRLQTRRPSGARGHA